MTLDELKAHPKVQEATDAMAEAIHNLRMACEQTEPGPFDPFVCADILTAATAYKRAWNWRNLAVADIVSRYGVAEA